MGRKSVHKEPFVTPKRINLINNDKDSNNLYRKRLRSWKEPSTEAKCNPLTNDKMSHFHRSTIYTYPIRLNHDHQSIPSSAILSESSAMESAFYRPSISSTSIQMINDMNNNHVPTLNKENRKRKTSSSSSSESLSSQVSRIKTLNTVSNMAIEENIETKQTLSNNLPLTHHENPTKRLRLFTHDSIITNHHSSHSPVIIDNDTIDINQLDPQEPLLSTTNNESFIHNSTSMDAAVKMVQPIVDIIFNAFEDHLKHIQTKSFSLASIPNTSSIASPFCSPPIMSCFPLSSLARPIVLHAVNFNIQLSRKQSDSNVHDLTNDKLSKNTNSSVISFPDLQEKLVSYILSNNLINEHYGRRNLKRIVQLAVVGFSALCGYWLL